MGGIQFVKDDQPRPGKEPACSIFNPTHCEEEIKAVPYFPREYARGLAAVATGALKAFWSATLGNPGHKTGPGCMDFPGATGCYQNDDKLNPNTVEEKIGAGAFMMFGLFGGGMRFGPKNGITKVPKKKNSGGLFSRWTRKDGEIVTPQGPEIPGLPGVRTVESHGEAFVAGIDRGRTRKSKDGKVEELELGRATGKDKSDNPISQRQLNEDLAAINSNVQGAGRNTDTVRMYQELVRKRHGLNELLNKGWFARWRVTRPGNSKYSDRYKTMVHGGKTSINFLDEQIAAIEKAIPNITQYKPRFE